MRQQTFARAAAGPRPTASEVLRPFIPPRSPSGRRLARHPSSNDDGAAESCDSSSREPWLPRRPACLLVLHCSRPSRPLKPPNCLGGWRPGSTPKMPHSHIAHEAKGPLRMGKGFNACRVATGYITRCKHAIPSGLWIFCSKLLFAEGLEGLYHEILVLQGRFWGGSRLRHNEKILPFLREVKTLSGPTPRA